MSGQIKGLPPDAITVAIALASWLLGPDVAEAVGPWSVILLSALGGAAWSVGQKPRMPRSHALGHILLGMGLAIITTLPAAELLARYASLEPRWTLAIAAALIAARPRAALRLLLFRGAGITTYKEAKK